MRRRKLAVFRVGKVMLQGAVGTEGANKVNGESWGTTGMGCRRHSREGELYDKCVII